jgi:hypothetical protein
MDPKKVPVCPHCDRPRAFEIQVMPQMFDRIEELRFVDWDSIAIYCCVNPECLVEKYSQEFGYIAFSDDFKNVRVGTDQEVAAHMALKRKQLAELDAVEHEEMKRLELEGQAEMKMEEGETPAEKKVDNSEQVRSEVEEGLGALLGTLDLNKK